MLDLRCLDVCVHAPRGGLSRRRMMMLAARGGQRRASAGGTDFSLDATCTLVARVCRTAVGDGLFRRWAARVSTSWRAVLWLAGASAALDCCWSRAPSDGAPVTTRSCMGCRHAAARDAACRDAVAGVDG